VIGFNAPQHDPVQQAIKVYRNIDDEEDHGDDDDNADKNNDA